MSSTHWNILSSWSKAGIGTSIVLELKKPSPSPPSSSSSSSGAQQHQSTKIKSTARIVFDMGATPCFDDAIPAKYVFLSHGHIDHVGALFSHARAHAVMCGGAAPTYFIPAPLLPQIEKCRDAMSLLDASNMHPDADGGEGGKRRNSLIKMKLVPVQPGDEVSLKGIHYGSKTSFFMRAYEVDHAEHPALGYIIGSRTTSGLKKEYQHLDNKQIRDLVKSGQVSSASMKADPVEIMEVAYSGDTCARGLIKRVAEEEEGITATTTTTAAACKSKQQQSSFDIAQLFQSELLLCELTFLDSSEDEQQRCKAEERGHLHINDLERIFSSHDPCWNEGGEKNTTTTTIQTTPMDNKESDSNNASPNGDRRRPKNIVFYHLSAKYQPANRALGYIVEGLPHQLRDRCHVAISSMLAQEEKLKVGETSLATLIRPDGCISLADYISWKDASI